MKLLLVGSPNSGKTTLFNRLTGIGAKTVNYPGSTVDLLVGRWREHTVIDSPGIYSLEPRSLDEEVTLNAITSPPRPLPGSPVLRPSWALPRRACHGSRPRNRRRGGRMLALTMEPSTLYTAGFGVGTTVALLVLLRGLQRVFSPMHRLARTNDAWRLLQVGHVFAVFLLGAAVVTHGIAGVDLVADLTVAAVYGVLGLVVIQLTGAISTRTLFSAQLRAELDRGNVAAGVAAGAHHVAIGRARGRRLGAARR